VALVLTVYVKGDLIFGSSDGDVIPGVSGNRTLASYQDAARPRLKNKAVILRSYQAYLAGRAASLPVEEGLIAVIAG
jgi:hypothetical protein